jgi:hypothetical protein
MPTSYYLPFVVVSLVGRVEVLEVLFLLELAQWWRPSWLFMVGGFCAVVYVDTQETVHVLCYLMFVTCSPLNTGLCRSVSVIHLQVVGGLSSGYSTHTLKKDIDVEQLRHHGRCKTTQKRKEFKNMLERYHIYKIVNDNLQMKALQVMNNQIAQNKHCLLSINTDNFK